MDLASPLVLSLCTGAGGLDIGVGLAEPTARSVCYVEHEGGALVNLVARMEEGTLDEAPLWTDLRTFDGRPWRGVVDLLIGGYPCQPFSVAGKRQGIDDPRHLWPHVRRIVEECRPGRCFFENVGNHLRVGYFNIVKPDLESLGYRVKEGLYEAAEVGATHKRERLFIMADRDGGGRRVEPRAAREGRDARADRDDASSGGSGRGEPERGGGRMADAIRPGLEGRERRELAYEGYGRLDPHAGGSGLFPPGPDDHDAWRRILARWPGLAPAIESSVRDVADELADLVGLARTVRTGALRLLGNGVVPLQAAYAYLDLARRLDAESDR